MGDFKEGIAQVLILDGTRDIEARCIRSDDGIAAFEEKPGCDRQRLARFSIARDLHQQRLTGGQTLDLAQKSGSVGCAQEHAALAFDGAIGDGAVDGTGARLIRVDQQVFKPPPHKQGCGLGTVQMVERDGAQGHGMSFQRG